MRVLWLSNVPFPDICKELNISTPVVGGWMYAGAVSLLKANNDIKLAVVCGYSGTKIKHITDYQIEYFLFPNSKNLKLLESSFIEINQIFNPDISHLHGTEYIHSLAYTNIADKSKLVVSIQGLVSVYASYYFGGISEMQIKKEITFRDIIRNDSLFQQKLKMEERGNNEVLLLKKIKHVIGRTTWDYANVWALNLDFNYHFCNESLRSGFYKKKWMYESCELHTIFLSQAHYPIKGLHQVIKAVSIVLKHFPKVKVYVAGNNFVSKPKYKRNGYASYINNLMDEYNVRKQFVFLGTLNEKEMIEQYLKANIFICPSMIENSPNSVGEAQLLGTPCIASYVGGTMDMIENEETGLLYRFEEYTKLAECIYTLFSDRLLCNEISRKGRLIAKKRHDSIKNARNLINIYQTIMSQ